LFIFQLIQSHRRPEAAERFQFWFVCFAIFAMSWLVSFSEHLTRRSRSSGDFYRNQNRDLRQIRVCDL